MYYNDPIEIKLRFNEALSYLIDANQINSRY